MLPSIVVAEHCVLPHGRTQCISVIVSLVNQGFVFNLSSKRKARQGNFIYAALFPHTRGRLKVLHVIQLNEVTQ